MRNWSNTYLVTFVLVMWFATAHSHGTHGTTFVIRYLSRFS